MPDTDDRDAVIACCCKMIKFLVAHEYSAAAKVVMVNAGTTTLWPNKDNSVAELINRADEALYMAKNQGRNRAVKL